MRACASERARVCLCVSVWAADAGPTHQPTPPPQPTPPSAEQAHGGGSPAACRGSLPPRRERTAAGACRWRCVRGQRARHAVELSWHLLPCSLASAAQRRQASAAAAQQQDAQAPHAPQQALSALGPQVALDARGQADAQLLLVTSLHFVPLPLPPCVCAHDTPAREGRRWLRGARAPLWGGCGTPLNQSPHARLPWGASDKERGRNE